MLQLKDFSKSYGSFKVLSIPALAFEKGVYWIKGENGSGKTTLFKSLAGIIPCNGDVSIQNEWTLKKNPVEYRKRVNYSEAEPLYPGFLTSKDLIRFIGNAKGATPQDQDELSKKLGVHDFMDQSCSTYSSGMLKKVSLTLAFLGDPRVIILDEPFITLDDATRKSLSDLIREKLSGDVVFLISSHQAFDDYPVDIKKMYAIRNKTLIQI